MMWRCSPYESVKRSKMWRTRRGLPQRAAKALQRTRLQSTLVGALDHGTSSTRFILFDHHAAPVASHQLEHAQHYPKEGWCEHDTQEVLDNARVCIDGAVAQLNPALYSPKDVAAIGITNQRETTVVWDKHTGKQLHNAIVWLDTRTSGLVDELCAADERGADRFRAVCGLPISTYFSALKLRWLIRHVPEVAAAVADGRALFGTMETWLLWNLSGGTEGGVHATDVTNASRTMLMDLRSCEWHESTCETLGVPRAVLPEIRSCSEVYGTLASTTLAGVPIAGMLGDQSAAMLGQCAFEVGSSKCTYGTGAFLLMTVGGEVVDSKHGLLSTVSFKLGPDAPVVYALEGGVACAGRAVRWLRDQLHLFEKAEDIEALAASVSDTDGVVLVPAFSGLLAPYWRPDARAVLVGMSLHSTKAHVARATLEAVAFQARELLDAMQADAGTRLTSLKVDGGMTVNGLLMQMQADAIGVPVERPREIETTALGAAFAAGLATGVWRDTDALRGLNPPAKSFTPIINERVRHAKLARWKDAVQRTLGLASHEN